MQMDEMTQQNAALVEQATAASQAMADQARDLTRTMDRYNVAGIGGSDMAAGSDSASVAKPERRSAKRPFTGKRPASAGPVARRIAAPEVPAARPKAVANGGEADWREF
jgi:methyl-accepting chemotaxis protein